MYKIKQYVINLQDRKINENIFIENGILYLITQDNKYKYEHDSWYINIENQWINMQGGVPIYDSETCWDEDIFEKINE